MSDEIIVRSDSRERATIAGAAQPAAPRQTPLQPRMAPRSEPQKAAPQPVTPLFTGEECRSLRSRWENLQVGFVDEPRHPVEQADQLVSEPSASSPPNPHPNERNSKSSGTPAQMSPPKIYVWPFSAIAPSSSVCSRCKSSSSRGSRSLRGQLFSQRVQHPRPTCFVSEPHFVVGNTRVAQCDLRSPLLAVPGER